MQTLDIASLHQIEQDGTHTVLIQMSGMSSLEQAQRISDWARAALIANVSKIGERDPNPPQSAAPSWRQIPQR